MDGYLHDINPFAIQFTQNFGLRWYGLSYLAGFYFGYLIIRWFSKRGLSPLTPQLAADFVFAVAVGTIVGGRLGYCIFYSPALLTEFNGTLPFWGVLAIHKGGMASHGGMIGIVAACIYFGRRHKVSPLHLFDLTALCGTIGIFFGRIANFINGELVGRPVVSDIPWAVKFPQDILSWPADKLQSIGECVARLGVSTDSWRGALTRFPYDMQSRNFVEGTLQSLVDRVQHHDLVVGACLRPHLLSRHPSQLYAALLEGAFLFVTLMFIWRAPRKPGVIAGCFFTLYAIVRIIGEQFRMPDPQIGYQIFGATRGQLLSLVLFIIGLGALYIWSMRPAPTMGGWGGNRDQVK